MILYLGELKNHVATLDRSIGRLGYRKDYHRPLVPVCTTRACRKAETESLIMIPMIPDCGVLSTPRRTSSLNLCENGLKVSPVPAKTALTSQKAYKLSCASPVPSEMSGVTLSSGFSFGFYKSPKNTVSPYRKIEPPPSRKHIRRPREGINKGVGHKIKKPKQKTKEKIKRRENVKTVVKRLKEGNYTPCLPSNRSPMKSPPSGEKKKRRVLSSPGMSLLETEPTSDFVPESKNGRFFTSRSRAAATVHIGKNIMLAAKYGDLSLKQREGTFTKKNVGRRIEDELHQYLKKSDENQSMEKVLSLPSVQANPRPVPTRVPSSPSPGKSSVKRRKSRTPSPQKYKNKTGVHNKSNVSGCSTEEELQDMESLLEEWDVCGRKETSAAEKFSSDKTLDSESIKPTRELGCAASPCRKTPMKFRQSDSPTRKSPRKLGKIVSPLRKSPRKLEEKASPLKKLGQSSIPTRTSPRKVANRSSQGEFQTNENVSPSRKPSRQGSLKSSENMKVFPIFDPHRRHIDQKIPLSNTRNKRTNKRQTVDDDSTQMMMDAGQKKFGAQQCSMCGVVYEVGSLSDEISHRDYHDRFLNALKFMGWKKEKLARDLDYLGGRVIMISSEDPPHCWRKVEEILEIVDMELGFSENGIHTKENTKAFVYVLERKIVGCLIAERLNKAYKVIPQESVTQGNGSVMCCSKTPTKVWAGISRLWVLQSERGKGIASMLVDAMRDNMIRNYFLSMDDIAFSDPTESGMGFAEAYTGKRDFFVYRREFM
ncbi:uncharacterized protein eco isoform X2 [Panulirus ornatus]|uniref:uncharacterized protein eco isoform X2 n=1 Tax=Panulirus ornatus TaxID=150431 RepID=UPI003A842E0E